MTLTLSISSPEIPDDSDTINQQSIDSDSPLFLKILTQNQNINTRQ